jgi:hypothetical protein
MSVKYSKNIVPKILDREDGTADKYHITKLSSYEVATEGYKIIKALAPSIGVSIDGMISSGSIESFGLDQSKTATGMLQLLSENLEVDDFTGLLDKLLGKMCYNEKEVEDWSDHFDDHPGDFFEIIAFSFKENFFDFFTKSTILSPMIETVMEIVPVLKNKMQNVSNDKEPEELDE